VRTLFAVGDEKQSIFSFQGADPAQFAINRRIFAELAQGAQHRFEDVPLLTSRRSAPEILSFVDTVFAPEIARAGLTSDGAAITHSVFRDTARGGVEFWPALRPFEDAESDPYAPLGAVQEEDPVARLAIQVADKIAGWLKNGARLPGKDRPVTAGDIMILLPRREPFGGEVIRQLKLREVPVAGADRVRLTEQIAAMDLIALGRFAVQRDDDLNLAALLRSPLCGLGDEELFILAHTRKGDLWQALVAHRNQMPFTAAHDFLASMLERADYAPPFEFYSHALTALQGRERLLSRLGPDSADTIDEFLSLTLTHERGHTPSLERFLDWVARGGTEIKRDMERGRDEVRVMTVHGAKGLEADIVILPDTTAQPGGLNRHDGLLFAPDGILFPLSGSAAPQPVQAAKAVAAEAVLNEHRRLLYVALTRARERLYVCGFEGKRSAREESWYALTRAAAESLGVEVTQGDGTIRAYGTLDNEQGDRAAIVKTSPALPGWITAQPGPEPVTPNSIQPSDIAGPSGAPPSPLGGKTRFMRGNVVHALLARLPEVAPLDRARIALAFARASRIADAEALVAETLAVLDDPQFADAFGPASKAEVALHATRPDLGLKAPIVGRLDRLAVLEDRVLIVDFKTNRPAPTRTDQIAGLYLDQMALYRAGAQAIFPGKRVACALVFTDGPRLLQLEDVVLEARIADISARLNGG
jgi:ATP-dependent helicase/nuclease subunit A